MVIIQQRILDLREDAEQITRERVMNRLTWIDEFGGNLAEYERMTGDKYEFMAKQGRPTRRTLLNAALNPMGDFYYKTGGETHESQIQISEFLVDCLLDRCDALIHVQRIVVDV